MKLSKRVLDTGSVLRCHRRSQQRVILHLELKIWSWILFGAYPYMRSLYINYLLKIIQLVLVLIDRFEFRWNQKSPENFPKCSKYLDLLKCCLSRPQRWANFNIFSNSLQIIYHESNFFNWYKTKSESLYMFSAVRFWKEAFLISLFLLPRYL